MLAQSYLEAHRYDGAASSTTAATRLVPCAVQPRDVAIVRDVWRYKFLTAPQLLELWWPDAAPAGAGQRRLAQALRRRLPRALPTAHAPRLLPVDLPPRPTTATACSSEHGLIAAGAALLRRARSTTTATSCTSSSSTPGCSPTAALLGAALSPGTARPTSTPPPSASDAQLRLDDDWSAEGLRDPRARLLRPDAVLEIERGDGDGTQHLPRRVRPHPPRRQELRQVPPLRRLPVLVVAPHAHTPTSTTPVRGLRLPRRAPARAVHGRRRPRAHRPPLAPQRARSTATGRGVHRFALDPPSSTCK